MKILYVLNSNAPGGMEKHVLDLVVGMVGLGHDVFVWCPAGEVCEWYKKAGATVIDKRIGMDIDPKYIYELYKFGKENKIDVLHAHELKSVVNAGIAGYFAGVKMRISHIHTPISEWQVSSLSKILNILVYTFVANFFYTYDIALTESRKNVKVLEGVKEEKIKIIPNGIDIARFDISTDERANFKREVFAYYGIPEGAFVFGNIGRMTEEKGTDTLVRAFSQFKQLKDTENVYLLLAGGGKLESQIKELIDSLKLNGRVFVTGVYKQEDFMKYICSFDAFVFPTRAEGFGIVLIEAMAASLPIICSDLEVLQEIGGSTVYYFESGNATDLSAKMINLFKRVEKFNDLGNGARERVKELFTMEKFVCNYAALYTISSVKI